MALLIAPQMLLTHLAMWELVQESALIDMLDLEDHVAIAATTCSCDNIFVKGKRDEDDDSENVDDGADEACTLGDLPAHSLGKVNPFEDLLEVWPSLHNQTVGCCESKPSECKGCDDGLSTIVESTCHEADRERRQQG